MNWLDELERLEKKATPGPWVRWNVCPEDCVSCAEEGAYHGAQDSIVPESDPSHEIITCDSGCYGPGLHDANLICMLRNHAAELVALARRAR